MIKDHFKKVLLPLFQKGYLQIGVFYGYSYFLPFIVFGISGYNDGRGGGDMHHVEFMKI